MTNWDEVDHPRRPAGSSRGGEWTKAEHAARKGAGLKEIVHTSVTDAIGGQLSKEWEKEHGEYGSPFWKDPGDKSEYLTIRVDGRLVAGATIHQRGATTFIDSIASHSPGAGLEMLNHLKEKNIFITAMASTEQSKAWFVKNGFRYVTNKPHDYNVIWVRRMN